MKVGFFGGSFDPIHFGHLNLAIHLLEKCQLDQVLFCPAFCSPFKMEHPPKAPAHLRLEMVKAAIQDVPKFQLLDWEIKRQTPSYTIDTVRHLSSLHEKLHLILSIDAAAHFHEWKSADELFIKAPPLIGFRGDQKEILGPWKEKLQSRLVPIPCFDVSSSEIRERIGKNLFCGHLVPKSALDIIQENQLYSQH